MAGTAIRSDLPQFQAHAGRWLAFHAQRLIYWQMTKMMAAASVDMVLAETSMRVAILRQDLELHNRTVLGSATKMRKTRPPFWREFSIPAGRSIGIRPAK